MELNVTHRRVRVASAEIGRQRGDIMLVTLVFVLMCLLGLVYSMRDTIVSNQMTGNNLVRQKDVQAADIALRMIEGQIMSTYAGRPLEATAVNKTWWRAVAAGTAVPSGAYWDTCAGGSATTTTRCYSAPVTVNSATIPYTAYIVVQPGGRGDVNACQVAQLTAMYYDISVHVKESNGATVANTETMYRLCALT